MISRDTQGHEVKDTNGARNPLAQEAVEEVAEVVLEGETLQSTIEAILFASAEPVSRRRLNAMLKEAPKGAVKEALLALEAYFGKPEMAAVAVKLIGPQGRAL